MSNIVFNWSPNDFIGVGIALGFIFGFVTCGLSFIVELVSDYFKSRKNK